MFVQYFGYKNLHRELKMDSLGLWLRHTKYKQRKFLPKFCDDDGCGCVEVMTGMSVCGEF